MASEESESDSKPNGDFINSFVSFLRGDGKKDIQKLGSESNASDEMTNSVEDMDPKLKEKTSGNTNGNPEALCNNTVLSKEEDGNSSTGYVEELKESDFIDTSENDSRSSSLNTGQVRRVAKRGRKRKHDESGTDQTPQRETPRRAARNVKRYIDEDVYNELDEVRNSDPDYNFSDSDDDPDFDPEKRRGSPHSPDMDARPKRGRGTRGRGRGRAGHVQNLRRSVESNDEDSKDSSTAVQTQESNEESLTSNNLTLKRRGRPPVYNTATTATTPTVEKPAEISDNTVSSTDDASKTAGKLSSAYNYAATRTRQNQAIRLPEGPNLTEEQLKLIESQFKSGDFVMSKKDTDMMENPPIWRIDGKSLLQKFQAFEKDGKMLYRNISTYSGWTAQAKALYVPVKVNFVFQSRYDTVVELIGFKGVDGESEEPAKIIDKPIWLPKNKDFEISEELRLHMPSFEIYLQTLISQALDNNFLQEIYEENDAYFVERVKVIDDLTEQRKQKILQMSKWDMKFQTSLDTWPCVNTMVTKNTDKCQACGQQEASMLSQFYGQPYDQKTLRSKEPSIWDLDHKNFETCDPCSVLSQLYNKVAHQKYDYYSQCKSTVTNMRVSHPNKSTTNVLRDLLANDDWITGLFRSMCTTWVKVDNLYEERLNGGTTPSDGNDKPTQKAPSTTPQPANEDDPDDPAAVEAADDVAKDSPTTEATDNHTEKTT